VGLGLEGEQGIEGGKKIGRAGVEPANRGRGHRRGLGRLGHPFTAWENTSRIGWISSRLVFSEAWLTTRRELIDMISSTSSRSFARSVAPEDTRSTIASARPTSGASSIEP